MFKQILCVVLSYFLSGCDVSFDTIANDTTEKSEYSVLQSYGYDYRVSKQDKPYMIFRRALNTDLTVLAFPIKNQSVGYVVMLAQSAGTDKVKFMPQADFTLSRQDYAAIKAEVTLAPEVEQFIVQHIQQ